MASLLCRSEAEIPELQEEIHSHSMKGPSRARAIQGIARRREREEQDEFSSKKRQQNKGLLCRRVNRHGHRHWKIGESVLISVAPQRSQIVSQRSHIIKNPYFSEAMKSAVLVRLMHCACMSKAASLDPCTPRGEDKSDKRQKQ